MNAGAKDMLKMHTSRTVEIQEVLLENGTELFFATLDNKLIYFTATCITKFC